MEYRRLGDTELEVSAIGLAAWPLTTTAWQGDDTEALAFLQKSYDLGINFFDTADVDGHGKGEELLGKAFRGNRELVVLATKVGYDFYNDPSANGVSGSRRTTSTSSSSTTRRWRRCTTTRCSRRSRPYRPRARSSASEPPLVLGSGTTTKAAPPP